LECLPSDNPKAASSSHSYSISPSSDPCFFTGMCADVLVNGQKIGVMGALHPIVLKNFDITYPASLLEIDIECFLSASS